MAVTTASDATPVRCRLRKLLWWLLGVCVGGSAILSAIGDWRARHVFLINATESLPNWGFLIRRGELPHRGQYVFFDPPPSALVRRHFGARPSIFGKIVYGMPGDMVSHDGVVVRINGQPVARMKPVTRFGEPLTPGIVGPVPNGCFFAGTPHKDGFDSRYAEIGFVCQRQIIGVGEPVL